MANSSAACDQLAREGVPAHKRRLIANGLSNAEIAQELYISDTTVKTHITHILQKLNLRDRVQAVVLAYQTGIFEADAQSRATPRVGGIGADDSRPDETNQVGRIGVRARVDRESSPRSP